MEVLDPSGNDRREVTYKMVGAFGRTVDMLISRTITHLKRAMRC